jgi:hypothetical protein
MAISPNQHNTCAALDNHQGHNIFRSLFGFLWAVVPIAFALGGAACRTKRLPASQDGSPQATGQHVQRPVRTGSDLHAQQPAERPRHVYSEHPKLRWCERQNRGNFRVRLSHVEPDGVAHPPVEFLTALCEIRCPITLAGGAWTWRVYDEGASQAGGANAIITREIVVHPGQHGAIVRAPDHDIDGDGNRDPAFLSVERTRNGGIATSIMVAFGSAHGFARVEVRSLEVTSIMQPQIRSRDPLEFPQIVRLLPLQDAPVNRHHIYVAYCFDALYLFALGPSSAYAGNSSWVPSLLAREFAREALPAGDLDGDGMADLFIYTRDFVGEPRRVMISSLDEGRLGPPSLRLVSFPGWHPTPNAERCYPASDIDGDGQFEITCVGARVQCEHQVGCREMFVAGRGAAETWEVRHRIVVLGVGYIGVSTISDVSGDGGGDWVVESSDGGRRVFTLMTSLQSPHPRADAMYVAMNPSGIMEGDHLLLSRTHCLNHVLGNETDAAIVGDLDHDGRDDLGLVEPSVCPGVGWKFVWFSLHEGGLRIEHRPISGLTAVSGNGYFARELTAAGSVEVFWLGESRENERRLRQAVFRRLTGSATYLQSP